MAQRDIERDKPLAMHEMFFNKDANRLDHLHGFISHEPSHISRPKLKLWGRINCLSMNDTLEATQILGSRLHQNKHLHFSLILDSKAGKSGRNSIFQCSNFECFFDGQKIPNTVTWLIMSHLNIGIFINFCPTKIDLSGNTVWPQASGFQKLTKINPFWHF